MESDMELKRDIEAGLAGDRPIQPANSGVEVSSVEDALTARERKAVHR